MNWYLAKITYHIICGDGNHTPQFDEQLRLVEADNELNALKKAKQIGEKEQINFLNRKQKLVQWKFVGVSELNPLPEFMDGAEIYSRVQETGDADAYIRFTRGKSAHLLTEIMRKSFLQKPHFPMATSVENCIGKIV